jgi:hypothetical protein
MNGFSDVDTTNTDKDERSIIISRLKQDHERAHDFMVSLISMISSNLLIPYQND